MKMQQLTNEDIEKIQSIIIEKIVKDEDEKQEQELNNLLDKLGALKSWNELVEESSQKQKQDLKL